MIGRRIGRYRVLSLLGKGGMASVWEARDELLGLTVALKLLADELKESTEARRRFRHEAEIVRTFDHPAIVSVYETGESDGDAFIAMGRVVGETLAARLDRGPVALGEAIRIVSIVAAALGYAHARGVVHRDVTPRNIMLADDGRVLVLDFGLAIAPQVSRVTTGPRPMGTPAYVSPEVLRGEEADPRSDLFALGVVFYELLTGAMPFRADQADVLTFAVLNQDVERPGALRPGIPAFIEHVALRLLSRDRRERYPNADELLADLGSLERRLPAAADAASAGAAPEAASAAATILDRPDAARCLAVAPFDARGEGEASDVAGALAADLAGALVARLARAGRLHVLALEPERGADASARLPGTAARRGAHLLVTGVVRVEQGIARADVMLRDPASGATIASERVEGSMRDGFALEDALVAAMARALRLSPPSGEPRTVAPDPAAREHFEQAVRYLRRHDHEPSVDAAVRLLERLAASGDTIPAYRALLARACLVKFRLTGEHVWESRSHSEVARVLAEAPEDPEVRLAVAAVKAHAGRHDEALAECAGVLENRPDDIEALLGSARALDALGRGAEAESMCRRAIAMDPEDWRGFHHLGMILFRAGEWARAVEPWRRVLQLTPDNARAASNLGGALFHLERHEEAVEAFRHSLSIAPNALAYQNVGTSEYHLGHYARAAEAFERAVALLPSDPVAWGNLGNASRLAPGREARAREALEQAVALGRERLSRQPGDGGMWGRLAGWLANLGRHDEATAPLERALELSSEDAQVLAHAVHVHAQGGRVEEALGWIRRAVRRGYSSQSFRRSPDLAALRTDSRFEAALAAAASPGTGFPD